MKKEEQKNELVSIVVPVYNAEKYLDKCIASILNQTYENIEIILVNDGSNDKSSEILDSWKEKDNRIVVKHKENGGVSTARNLGIHLANGKWIMFVDPDDYLDSYIIEILVRDSEDCDMVSCGCIVNGVDNVKEYSFFESDKDFVTENEKRFLLYNLVCPTYFRNDGIKIDFGVPWAKIYNREIINNFELRFDTKLRRCQDNVFNIDFISKCGRIRYKNTFLYHYSYDNISSLGSQYKDYYFDTFLHLSIRHYDFLVENDLLKDFDKDKVYTNCQFKKLLEIIMLGLFNKQCKDSRSVTNDKIRELKNASFYKYIIDNGSIKNLSSFKHKCIYIILKLKLFRVLEILCKIL